MYNIRITYGATCFLRAHYVTSTQSLLNYEKKKIKILLNSEQKMYIFGDLHKENFKKEKENFYLIFFVALCFTDSMVSGTKISISTFLIIRYFHNISI